MLTVILGFDAKTLEFCFIKFHVRTKNGDQKLSTLAKLLLNVLIDFRLNKRVS